jgi:hypothetical protein
LGRLARDKHTILLCPFVSYKENGYAAAAATVVFTLAAAVHVIVAVLNDLVAADVTVAFAVVVLTEGGEYHVVISLLKIMIEKTS